MKRSNRYPTPSKINTRRRYKRKYRIRKKFLRKWILCMGIVFIVISFTLGYRAFPKSEFKSKDSVTIVKTSKTYHMNVSYPIVHKKKLDRAIEAHVEKTMEEMLSDVEKKKKDITIDSTFYHYQNVDTVVFEENGRMNFITYDNDTKKMLEHSDFFKTDQTSIKKMREKLESKLIAESFQQNVVISNEELKKNIDTFGFENIPFIFSESGVTFFIGKELLPTLTAPRKILFSYSEVWDLIEQKRVAKKNHPTKEELQYERMKIPNVTGKKVIALTFDDGPGGAKTTQLLDGLKARNVKATFFVLGNRAERFPEIVKRAIKEGHEVGSHTYDHQNLRKISNEGVLYEINHTNEIINGLTSKQTTLLRPPYGSFDDRTRSAGMNIIMWNVDSEDWRLKDRNKIVNKLNAMVSDGDIILMHDIYQFSVDAALDFIDAAKARGFEFVTVSQLAKIKGYQMQAGKAYYSFETK